MIIPKSYPRALLALCVLSILAALPARAQRATVEVTVSSSPSSTRVILTHSRPLIYDVIRSKRAIEIVYKEAVEVLPPKSRIDDPLLEGYRLEEEHRLVLRTGREYRSHEIFELRNPHRIIIDLLGRRAGKESPAKTSPRGKEEQTVIVIDPGHGGVEEGAVGPTGLLEKDVTLDLARRLQAALGKDPSLSVVLTRDGDRLVGLDERTAIANHNRADLFLSIHLNSSPRAGARGAETYFLSTDATDDEARTLAALENRAAGVDEHAIRARDGERRNLDLVLWDLAQNQYLAESSLLAESMQRHLNELIGTRDRGVRQAPFRVLMGATMPAILVEVGFVSNSEEEARFRNLGYRNQVVSAMTAAVHDFLTRLDRLAAPGEMGMGEGTGPR